MTNDANKGETLKKYSAADIDNMEQRFRALFVNSLSGFKSANLVGSVDRHGVENLAIVNSVFHLGANPPLLGMIIRPHTVKRDTLENIQQTSEYTLNHVNSSIVGSAHQTSARYGADVSEFEEVGLTPYYSSAVKPPYVKESQVKIGMRLESIQNLAINNTELVIGRVEEVILEDNAVIDDGYIDLQQLDTVAIASLDGYYQPKLLSRFEYAKPGKKPTPKGVE